DEQRPHDPRLARLDLSDAVSAREVPAAAVDAERLVHPGRARYLEPAPLQIPGPLRDDEGRPGAGAALWPDRMATGPGADPRDRQCRGPAAFAHGRDRRRRLAGLLRPVPRPL